jgi:hypothetical protein
MTLSTTRRLSALTAASLLGAAVAIPAFAAGPVSVTVNGQQANLNPAPTERAGRVFVPLRGVFEQLGATVVYQAGVINATGRGHTVSLRIGSQQATVDGQQQTVDVAPFIIGASTYVPLRFVSQALGASVNYDGSNRVVAINTNGNAAPSGVITPVPNAQGGGGSITLTGEQPGRGANVPARRPTIGASFSGTVDPTTVRVSIDDNDVTNESTRSPRGFLYIPRAALNPGPHRVRVSGTDSGGNPFNRTWGFTSGTSTAAAGSITSVRPANGEAVPPQFTVSGRTSPYARVTIQVGSSGGRTSNVAGIIGALLGAGAATNTASATVQADANGRFAQQVNINAPSGTQLQLVVTATDPTTGASGVPVQESLTIQ